MATIITVERRVGGIRVPNRGYMDRWLVVMFSELFHSIALLVWQVCSDKVELSLYLTKILLLFFFFMLLLKRVPN